MSNQNPLFITHKQLELKQMLVDLYQGHQKLREDEDKLKELEHKAIYLDGYITGLKEHQCPKSELNTIPTPKPELPLPSAKPVKVEPKLPITEVSVKSKKK